MTKRANSKGSDPRFKRHGRVVTVVGAIIVFFTFITNEVFRERLKTIVDQIDTATSVFAIRQENSQTRQTLNSIEMRFSDDAMMKGNVSPELMATNRSMEFIGAETMELEASIENVADLLDKSEDPKDEEEERALKIDFQSVRDVTIGNGTSQPELTDIVRKFQPLQTRTQNLEANALKHANQEKADMESRYTLWTWFSYALYIMGWGLGIAGRLSGAQELVSET